MSAWAIRTRCCSPPESVPTRLSAKSSAPTSTRASSTAWRCSFVRRPISEAVAVETECDQVPCSHRHVGVEDDLLRYIAQRSAALTRIRPPDLDCALVSSLGAQDDPEQRGLAYPVGPDQPGELAGPDLEGDVVQHSLTAEGDRYPVDLEDRRDAHRCSVDVPWSTAAWIAATSASIQDW